MFETVGGGGNQMPLCTLINAGRTEGPDWFSSSSLAHMWPSVKIMILVKLKTNVRRSHNEVEREFRVLVFKTQGKQISF